MVDLRHGWWLGFGVALVLAGCEPQASIPQGVQVYFSPPGGPTGAVVNALDQATNTVLVQAYSFTSAPIAKALVEAHRRGVKVQVILDDSQRTEKYSEADFLKNNGIETLIDAQHAIAHNKIMIIDDYVVITGSFNFTKAAEDKNAENLLIIEKAAEHSFSLRKYYPDAKLVTANYKGLPAVCTGVLCLTDASKGETLTYILTAKKDQTMQLSVWSPNSV